MKGDLIALLVTRNGAVVAPSGWTPIETAYGVAPNFLDVYARVIDDNEPTSIVVTSASSQELQGQLFALRGGVPNLLKEASAHAAFVADATPDAPASSSKQAINLGLVVWCGEAALALTAPAGFTAVDSYTSAVVSARSFLAAYKVVGATGAFAPASATSAGALTGRAFTLVLRDRAPLVPSVLVDSVPGNIGFIGKDVRIGR
ncbi:MAG: hypothetical protein M3619_00585 [Myxococcota bacterium]|nr:hypothetical protein [Myxococcota bacterium]